MHRFLIEEYVFELSVTLNGRVVKQMLLVILLSLATVLAAQEPVVAPADTLALTDTTEVVTSACPFLDTERCDYYLDGNPISKKEAEAFLRLNDPEAWQRYRTGNAMWISGWCLTGVGAALTTVGMGYLVVGIAYTTGSVFATVLTAGEYQPDTEKIGQLMVTGGVLSSIGGVMTAASIPLIVVGSVKKYGAHELYNENCAKKQEPQLVLSLRSSANGVGLALKF